MARALLAFLLDQENRCPLFLDILDDIKDFLDKDWSQSHRRFIQTKVWHVDMSARPIASICCSPPDRVAAS